MVANISLRSQKTLLLGTEEDEPNAAPGSQSRSNHAPGDLDDQRNVRPVVETSGAEIPRVEMGSHDDNLLGQLAASKLRHDVLRLEWTAYRRWAAKDASATFFPASISRTIRRASSRAINAEGVLSNLPSTMLMWR